MAMARYMAMAMNNGNGQVYGNGQIYGNGNGQVCIEDKRNTVDTAREKLFVFTIKDCNTFWIVEI